MTRARRIALRAFAALAALAAIVVSGSCALEGGRHRGPVTDHFDGERFFNPGGPEREGFSAFLRWQLERTPGTWRPFTDAPPGPKPEARVGGGRLRAAWVNHATVLVQVDGVNVLTDPIWSERCSPFSFAGPARVIPPGIRFEDLPPIDAVVLSHNHYDHLDLPTLRRLHEREPLLVLAGLGNRGFLLDHGLTGARELDWWQQVELPNGVRIHSVPVRHFANRSLFDQDRTLWTGWVIEGPSGRAYVAGDSGFGPHFAEARERLGPMRLAVLPIGAYEPVWFMNRVHVTPAQAVDAALALAAGTALGMHFGTFELADEGQDEPPRALAAALAAKGVPPERFWVLAPGEGRDVP